jgi:hypothetical protein
MQQKNNCANRVTDIPAYAEVVLETHFHHLRKGEKTACIFRSCSTKKSLGKYSSATNSWFPSDSGVCLRCSNLVLLAVPKQNSLPKLPVSGDMHHHPPYSSMPAPNTIFNDVVT